MRDGIEAAAAGETREAGLDPKDESPVTRSGTRPNTAATLNIETIRSALEAAKGIQVRVALMCNGKDFDNASRELDEIKAKIDAALLSLTKATPSPAAEVFASFITETLAARNAVPTHSDAWWSYENQQIAANELWRRVTKATPSGLSDTEDARAAAERIARGWYGEIEPHIDALAFAYEQGRKFASTSGLSGEGVSEDDLAWLRDMAEMYRQQGDTSVRSVPELQEKGRREYHDLADKFDRIASALATPSPKGGERLREALADVAAERARQISAEGWTPEHDDEHGSGELLDAALCYAQRRSDARMFGYLVEEVGPPARWPWDLAWWKPKDERRDLVRAAALMVAEIERLDRAALSQENGS